MTEVLAFLPNETKPTPSVVAPVPTKRREGARVTLVGRIDPKGPISLSAVKQYFLCLHPDTPKTLVIRSEGGSSSEGFKIYDWLRALPTPLMTVAEKTCYSAALTIFLAGDFRIATPDVEFLLHRACMPADDLPRSLNAQMLRNYTEELISADDRILNLLEARTGVDRSMFEEEIGDECNMSESFAVDSGIVHEWPGLNRVDPTRPETARQIQAAKMILPPRLISPNYLAACCEAAHFAVVE